MSFILVSVPSVPLQASGSRYHTDKLIRIGQPALYSYSPAFCWPLHPVPRDSVLVSFDCQLDTACSHLVGEPQMSGLEVCWGQVCVSAEMAWQLRVLGAVTEDQGPQFPAPM